MTNDARDAPYIVGTCTCGNRSFYAVPDGADSYLIECTSCGKRGEISAGRGVTFTLVEQPDEPTDPR